MPVTAEQAAANRIAATAWTQEIIKNASHSSKARNSRNTSINSVKFQTWDISPWYS